MTCRSLLTYLGWVADDVFHALANPVRRRILTLLREGPRPAGEIARHFEVGRPAVSEQLRVLRKAGLVREEPRGQHRYYYLDAAPLAEAADWLGPFERYWRERLRDLREVLEQERKTEET